MTDFKVSLYFSLPSFVTSMLCVCAIVSKELSERGLDRAKILGAVLSEGLIPTVMWFAILVLKHNSHTTQVRLFVSAEREKKQDKSLQQMLTEMRDCILILSPASDGAESLPASQNRNQAKT